jgi:asparagine synthase (glutamine-hydrolysing)
MCGIAGIISPNTSIVQMHALKSMANSVAHRGPDGEGFYINPNKNIGLAHRRLAIIDLSDAAAQPMHYLSRYSIVFNGEIYNYKELKSDLQKVGYCFSNDSDTEVILAAYDFYKESCVKYFDGMFAFGIWDEVTQTFFCARDTFGEKPFYYFLDEEVFVFGSEMKALWAIGIDKTVDEKMMVNYLTLGYVQNASNKSQTFYKKIFSLPPAHTATLKLNGMSFSVNKFRDINREIKIDISKSDAVEKLEGLLKTSIQRRMRSDVSIGASLSGGLDSSTIAYFLKQQNPKKFETFSASFTGFEKDETELINELSKLFLFQNNKITPNVNELTDDFEKLSYHQEEPFLSSSIYAQYKVYQLASKHNVKVLLDGQGADETLAGYTKYLHWYLQELACKSKFSTAKKERLALLKNNINVKWGIKNIVAGYLPAHVALALEKKEYNKIISAEYLSSDLIKSIKGNEWQGIYKPVITKLNDILYYNTMQFGLEELLRYADRNSMANGVEVRLPFLNFELVSFIFSLPSSLKINDGFTKAILRNLMDDKLPKSIVRNPIKIGFETPQKKWMEDKKFQTVIQAAKQKLVNERILKPSVMQSKISPMETHEAENMDWRYLSMAAII